MLYPTRPHIRSFSAFRSAKVCGLALVFSLPACHSLVAQDITVIDGQIVKYPVTLATGADLNVEQGGQIIVNKSDAVAGDDGHVVVNGGRIETGGSLSEGIDIDDFNTVINTGIVKTGGSFSDGIYVEDFNTIINSGIIETIGGSSDGIDVEKFNTVTNTGVIETSGNNAEGITVDDHNAVTNVGVVETGGENAEGIYAYYYNTVTNAGLIETGGKRSMGIKVYDYNAVINVGVVETSGLGATGIEVDDYSSVTNVGIVETSGFDAAGIEVDDKNAVTNTGRIKTSGKNSSAIVVEGDYNDVSNNGVILTRGAFSNGIDSNGNGNTLSNAGWVKTTGESASAVSLGTNSALTNTGTLIATGAGSHAVLGGFGTQTVTIGQGSQIIGAFDLGKGDDIVNVEGGPTISQVLTVENVETVNVADNFIGVVEYNEVSKTISSVDLTGTMSLGALTGALTDSVQQRIHAQAGLTGAWASVFGQHRDLEAFGSRQGYSFAFGGVMGGYERAVGIGRFGVVGGASINELETQDFDSTTLDGQSIFAGAYFNTLFGPAKLITGLLAGIESNDSERILVDNLNGRQTARGTIDSTFVSASMGIAGTGWALGGGGLTLQPSGLVNYTASFQNDYTERGAARGNLSVDSRISQQLSARAQLALDYTVFSGVQAVLRTGVDARTSFEDDIDAILEGQPLTLGGDDINENFIGGFVGLGAAFAPNDRFSVSGDVEYQFGQDDTETFAAGINVNYTF